MKRTLINKVLITLALVALSAQSMLGSSRGVWHKDQNSELKTALKGMGLDEMKWWQVGVVYQVYPKSFKDSNNDGVGDIQGIISKLDHLNDGTEKSLGIDAIWMSPFFKSPQIDSGYDISDYKDIDPMFGTLDDFKQLVKEAHKRKIRIILDYVGNHCSDQHPWFQESKKDRTNPKADWFVWKDAKPDGSVPNNWLSVFGGLAWEWVEERQQYYLHEFTKQQVDLNWRNPELKAAMLDVYKFWLDLGVDGFRMDALAMMMKNKDFLDNPWWPGHPIDPKNPYFDEQNHLYDTNDDDMHPLLRDIRTFIHNINNDAVILGEVVVPEKDWAKYFGHHDELDMPFYFDLMGVQWQANRIRETVKRQEDRVEGRGWPNYVFSNHDSARIPNKFGMENARAAALILLTLRGSPTIYNGDELGMPNTKVPVEDWTDPQAKKDGSNFCRDFCRTPFQWDTSPNAGFSPQGVKTWLPIAEDYQKFNKEVLEKDPSSVLNLYRKLIWLRKRTPALNSGDYLEVQTNKDDTIYAFRRISNDEAYTIILNTTPYDQYVRVENLQGRIILSTLLDREEEFKFSTVLRPNEAVIIKKEN